MKKPGNNGLPFLCLFLQVVALIILYAALHRFKPVSAPDSISYIEMPMSSLQETLSGQRTFVYPLFLKCVRLLFGDLSPVPILQFALHILAVFFFMLGLRIFGFSGGLALFTASPLLYVEIFHEYFPFLLTESLSSSIFLLTVGFLLLLAVTPRNVYAWLSMTLTLFLAYQTRPALLFIIGVMPVVGLFFYLFCPARNGQYSDWKKLAVGLVSAALIPYIAFCSLRWVMVGHFGLVSFGGYNIVAITAQMLSTDMIVKLPPHLREIAEKIQAERIRQNLVTEHELGPRTDYLIWRSRYNPIVHQVVTPVTQSLFGNDVVLVNQKMTELSFAILKIRYKQYLQWVMTAFKDSVQTTFSLPLIFSESLFILLLYFLFILKYLYFRIYRKIIEFHNPELPLEHASIFLLAVCCYFWGTILIVLVEPPLTRYVVANAIFIPCWLSVVIFFLGRNLLTAPEPKTNP